jgi:SAM-dependent methyltransferase
MGDLKPENNSTNQDSIWSYFQNRHPEVFEGATARMDYILRKISRRKTTAIPRVLNIGAGNGYLEEKATRLGWVIYSLDPDEGAVNRLLEKGIRAYRGYMGDMPFADDSFDFVVASEVLEHLDVQRLHEGLKEVVRVMRGGAWFIGTVPYRENLALNEVVCPRCQEVFHRWGHQRSFDLQTMRSELLSFFNKAVVKRKGFVAFRGRSCMGKIKSLVRYILAHYGAPIASPNIYFAARKPQEIPSRQV